MACFCSSPLELLSFLFFSSIICWSPSFFLTNYHNWKVTSNSPRISSQPLLTCNRIFFLYISFFITLFNTPEPFVAAFLPHQTISSRHLPHSGNNSTRFPSCTFEMKIIMGLFLDFFSSKPSSLDPPWLVDDAATKIWRAHSGCQLLSIFIFSSKQLGSR